VNDATLTVFYSSFDIIADNANVARPRRRLVTRGKINRTVSNVFCIHGVVCCTL